MKRLINNDRFVPPVMQAFRAAFKEKDSSKKLESRSGADERIINGRRITPRNAVSEMQLKQELSDDLAALLNTVNLASTKNLDDFDHVRQSILNFGVHDLSSISSESQLVENIGAHLKDILQRYESRLVEGTLAVIKGAEFDEVNTRISFYVAAEMYATPTDVPVEFVADIESYSGKMNVKRV
jgi:type VI secretion system protein ImpF